MGVELERGVVRRGVQGCAPRLFGRNGAVEGTKQRARDSIEARKAVQRRDETASDYVLLHKDDVPSEVEALLQERCAEAWLQELERSGPLGPWLG